jgi:hypothetical protein
MTYYVVGLGRKDREFTTKEAAERYANDENYFIELGGGRQFVSVVDSEHYTPSNTREFRETYYGWPW